MPKTLSSKKIINDFSLVVIDGLKAVQDFAYMLYCNDIAFVPGEHFDFEGEFCPILNRLMDECVEMCNIHKADIEEQMQ